MDDSDLDSNVESVEVPYGGPIIALAEYGYDSKGERIGVRRFRVPPLSAFGPLPARPSPPAPLPEGEGSLEESQYDPRIEFILMRSGRRLGVEYRRFINGKLALKGFVKEQYVDELGPSDGDAEGAGESGEYRNFNPVDIPEARLERMARLALERALGDS